MIVKTIMIISSLIADVEKPTFGNCPPKTLHISKLSRLNREAPIAQDNSKYLKSVTVRPILFYINQTILSDTIVTYIAEDYAGNVGKCTFQIIVKGKFNFYLSAFSLELFSLSLFCYYGGENLYNQD